MPLINAFTAINTAIRDAGIIPDVIPDDTFTPTALLAVTWPDGQEALLGNMLTRADTAAEPSISFTPMTSYKAATDVGYTLVMTDPDAPSRADPALREWRHWLVTGLRAPAWTALDTGDLEARATTRVATTPYEPPTPPRGTGPHRYVFLLYEEPGREPYLARDADEGRNGPKDRAGWRAARFAARYGLRLVGVNYVVVEGEA